jgi:hypothetical protein
LNGFGARAKELQRPVKNLRENLSRKCSKYHAWYQVLPLLRRYKLGDTVPLIFKNVGNHKLRADTVEKD